MEVLINYVKLAVICITFFASITLCFIVLVTVFKYPAKKNKPYSL